MSANAELAWMLLAHLALTGLPGVAAALVAARRGLRTEHLLLTIALAASGGTAIVSFWAYYADPILGQSLAFFAAIGSVALIAWCWRDGIDRAPLAPLAVPLALWALASTFVLLLGFLHGGTAEPLATAANRFSHPLPGDNEIPLFFADWYWADGHGGTPPPYGDWLSSDRPPLQVGYVLAQRPFGWDGDGLHYQVLGVVVQQLWVVAAWAVLLAARLGARARGLAILAALIGDVAIVHGFFVWPKLLAAAFALAVLAIVISPDWERSRRNLWVGALVASLCALSMLAHGGSVFFLIPVLGLAALRGLPSARWLGVAAAVGVVLLGSWAAYQRYADPPGDRLVKWQLGGSLAIDDRGAAETILDGYREAGLGTALRNKWENLLDVVGAEQTRSTVDAAADQFAAGDLEEADRAVRSLRFFNLLPLLGLLLLGPLAMAVRRLARGRPDGPEWSFALTALGLSLAACAVWVLLMFGSPDSRTVVHQGSLAVPLLAAVGCVAGAYAVSRRFAIGLVALNSLAVLLLYVPSSTPPGGGSYSAIAALLAVASLVGFGLLALRPDAGEHR